MAPLKPAPRPSAPPSQVAPPSPLVSPAPTSQPEVTVEEVSPKTYSVKAHAKDGKMQIPCPVAGCGGMISASPEDTRVVCPKDSMHVFTLEPPQDVVDAITRRKTEEQITSDKPTVYEKPTEALVESVLAGGGSDLNRTVVPPTETHKKTYSGVL